jgi:hypothetical protein
LSRLRRQTLVARRAACPADLARLLHRCVRYDVRLTPSIRRELRPIRNFRPAARIFVRLVGGSKRAPGRPRVQAARATPEGNATGMHARSAMSCLSSRALQPSWYSARCGEIIGFRRGEQFAPVADLGNEVTFRRCSQCQVKRPLVPPTSSPPTCRIPLGLLLAPRLSRGQPPVLLRLLGSPAP